MSGYRGDQAQPSHGYQPAVISRQESHPVISNTSPALVAQALSGRENISTPGSQIQMFCLSDID